MSLLSSYKKRNYNMSCKLFTQNQRDVISSNGGVDISQEHVDENVVSINRHMIENTNKCFEKGTESSNIFMELVENTTPSERIAAYFLYKNLINELEINESTSLPQIQGVYVPFINTLKERTNVLGTYFSKELSEAKSDNSQNIEIKEHEKSKRKVMMKKIYYGDKLTDEELEDSLEIFKSLWHKTRICGSQFRLMDLDLMEKFYQLDAFKQARLSNKKSS